MRNSLIVGLWILLASLGALAQESPQPLPDILPEPSNVIERILAPGDKLEVHIAALPELEKIYEIRIDGSFYHPLVGEVKAAGRTISDIKAVLQKRLKKELRNPSFRVGLHGLSQSLFTVSVLGEVEEQGSYELPVGATVLDLIAKAGGLTKTADPEMATLYRDEKQYEVALQPTLERPQLAQVRPGDILYVVAGAPVNVVGAVFEPGVYGMSRRKATPRNAMMAAGGPKEEAALARVRLVRVSAEKPIFLDLRPSATTPIPEEAQRLMQGDILVVPIRQAVLVAGTAGGAIDLRGDETLIDIILKKSLHPKKFKLGEVRVIRSDDVVEENEKVEEYDLRDYFKDGKCEAATVAIRDGDLVVVPERGKGFNFLQSIGWARLLFLGF